MIGASLFGGFDTEVAGLVEEVSEAAAHERDEGTDDFVGGHAGLDDPLAYTGLDFGALENLIGGLIGASGSVAGSSGCAGAIASIPDEFVDEPSFTISEAGLASSWIDFSFAHG
jgi:hypothetical protein